MRRTVKFYIIYLVNWQTITNNFNSNLNGLYLFHLLQYDVRNVKHVTTTSKKKIIVDQ